MKPPSNAIILITGCSSGIGLALAKLLWRFPEYRVVATARENSLHTLRGVLQETDRFWIRKLDVTSELERKFLIDEIEKQWGVVNILVNNAGISYRGTVEHMDDTSEFHQMNTNYLGPMALTRLILPGMRKRGRGKIINISSVSGMLAMPTMGSYSASKYALEGASESLWYEMRPLGINVTLVQPGFVHSRSFEKVYLSKAAQSCSIDPNDPYCDYYATMEPFVAKMMAWSRVTPEKVAKVVLKMIRKKNPPLRELVSLDATVFHFLRRFLPRRLLHEFLFFCLPGSRRWAQKYSKARR